MEAYRHQDPGLQEKGKAKTAERRQGEMGQGGAPPILELVSINTVEE